MRSGARLCLLALSCFLLLAASSDTEQPLHGYSAASSRSQRRGAKFRAIPGPRTSVTTAASLRLPPPRGLALCNDTRNGCRPSPKTGAQKQTSRLRRAPKVCVVEFARAHKIHRQTAGAGAASIPPQPASGTASDPQRSLADGDVTRRWFRQLRHSG